MNMIPLYISEDVSYKKQFSEAKQAWKDVKFKGNDTGCWSDGLCMNLIRNKLIRLKKLSGITPESSDFSEWEIPEKVSFDYDHKKRKKRK